MSDQQPISVSGTGLINVRDLSQENGQGSFQAGSIVINHVDKSKVNAGQFVANPTQLSDQTSEMDVNYVYSGEWPIPVGNDSVVLNPAENQNPRGAAVASAGITGGTVYIWAAGGEFRKGSSLAIGHMTYKKNLVND